MIGQFEAHTTLDRLRSAYTGEPAAWAPYARVGLHTAPPGAPPATFVSTITGVLDVAKGLAQASIPTRGPMYWQKVTDQDLLLPPSMDPLAALGCVIIAGLLAAAVFK